MIPDPAAARPLSVLGYPRAARPAGVRDHVLVVPSVVCSGTVAAAIAGNVPAAVSIPHDHGCGQVGDDLARTRRTLLGVCENPNVAGVLLVGLGCETMDSAALEADLDVPVRRVDIQAVGGTDRAIRAGTALARDLRTSSPRTTRREVTPDALTVGVTVSDLQPSTVERVLPELGLLVSAVVNGGGHVVVAGAEALVPHEDDLDEVADVAPTANDVGDLVRRHRERYPPTGVRRGAREYDLDRLSALWGARPVDAVLEYGERAPGFAGVSLLATHGGFEAAATGLVAAGCQVVVHGTADGIPSGHPVAPVVTASADPATTSALPDDVDVDLTGAHPGTLLNEVLAVIDGEESAAERHGIAPFAVSRTGPSL